MANPIDQDSKASITGDSPSGHPSSGSGGFFSSAKIVADAAQSAYKRESFDKVKTAGAAEEILTAASEYGKLEEKGYGKYVDQAEDYLHKIRGVPVEVKATSEEGKPGGAVEAKPESVEEEKSGGGGGGGGGAGDYLKIAEGFVQKYQSEEGGGNEEKKTKEEESSGGGFGNYFKMAEGFLKK